ncbi:MAG: PQQ-dependent dehydrogenase, methanol/ethanol family [Pseudomonadota bacterium]
MLIKNTTIFLGAVLLAVACGREKSSDVSEIAVEAPASTGAVAAVENEVVDVQDEPPAGEADPAATRLLNARNTPEEWLTFGGDYEEQRFSRLTKVNKQNVSDLGVAWSYDLKTSRGVESTPLIVDGVMYATGAWSIVYALDAKTGEELWVHDPEVSGEDAAKGCCDVVNRGVAYADGKVFLGVFDGRLQALDAKTGAVQWSVVTVDQSKPYTITGAPRYVNGNVLIGNGGGELGVRGYLSAYDAETGALSWRFYTAPNPEKKPDGAASDSVFAEFANATWGDTGGWTTDGGGATVWDSIIYDSVNNNVVFGVGNGSPWNSSIRDPESDGDNLFLSSIVAVNADTGEYQWHYQTTPRDEWDYTATQTLIIAELPLGENGADRRVVMQAPKNGFFYVIDAATGEFISGDAYAITTWATGIDENGRPIENPAARAYNDAPFLALPAPAGAHNWHPMAFSPQTGLAYIPAQQLGQLIQPQPEGVNDDLRWNIGYDFAAGLPPTYPAGTLPQIRKEIRGSLLAWDPVKREPRWAVEYPEPFNSGILTTSADLLFQGDTRGGFHAYDAATGERLWSKNLKSGIQSAPATYEIDGEQYVAVTTGWGGSWALNWGVAWEKAVAPDVGRVFVFKLGGDGDVPEQLQSVIETTPKAETFGDSETVAAGFQRYSENCMVCHGPLAISAGVTPDLRWSYMPSDAENWKMVVLEGALSGNGMPSFAEQLSAEDAEAIRAYVLDQAWLAVVNGDATAPSQQ